MEAHAVSIPVGVVFFFFQVHRDSMGDLGPPAYAVYCCSAELALAIQMSATVLMQNLILEYVVCKHRLIAVT